LLNELEYSNQPLLTVSELSQNVEKAVANNVSQVPETGVLQGAGDELGEFIFINVDVSVSGASAEQVKVKVNVTPAEASTNMPGTVEKSAPVVSPESSVPTTAPDLLPMPTL